MGADFYLPDVLQACHERYGQAAVLVDHLVMLAQGQSGPLIAEAGQHLKEALVLHAHQSAEMSPALFDLVAEAADLAQGEMATTIRALAAQVADLVQEACTPLAESAEDLGSPGSLTLTADLLALLTARPDEAIIRRGATLLAQLLLSQPEPAILTHAGQLIGDILAGNPSGVLALLVEHRFLPALEHMRTSQAKSLKHLEEALAPLIPDLSVSPQDMDEIPTARALLQFHQLASTLFATIARLHQQMQASCQTPADWHDTLPAHLEDARQQLEDLWQEEEHLRTRAQAIEALRPLFLRTLPPLPDFLTRQNEMQASPLQRAFGCLMEHHLLWPNLLHLVTRELETARTILAGDFCTALSEICSILALLLAPEQTAAEGPFLSGAHLPLTPGVQMIGADLMGYCYLQTMNVAQQARRDMHLRTWVEYALCQRPLDSTASGLLLRFWRLLQGDASLWIEALAARLHDALRQPDSLSPDRRRDARLEELQGLLEDRPRKRLESLLTLVQTQVAADSPLIPAVCRLRTLLQGDLTIDLARSFTHLEQEVDRHQDWPADRRRDVLWLLTLARSFWQAPDGQHEQLLYATLRTECKAVGIMGTALHTLLAAGWPEEVAAQRLSLRNLLSGLQKELPEEGPQVFFSDPRVQRDWKVRLLCTLVQARQVFEEHRDSKLRSLSMLSPLLQALQCLFSAWRFPAQGYFRDPYNDTVRRRGAYEIAGSSGRG
jgi:hypothetical protein